MESCECAFVSEWAFCPMGVNWSSQHISAGLRGLIYPSLALSHGVLQTSSSHLIVFCLLLFLCVTKAEKKDMSSSNAGTHFRRGLNEGLLLCSLWHLLSCWAHAKHRSLICSLLKTKASKLMMSVWKSGGVVLKFGLSSDEHLMMPAGQLWFESHPRVCSRATSRPVGRVAQPFHCGFMHRMCHQPIDRAIRLELPVGEERLHTGTPGLTGAQMIDYKITATSLKAKQGLWPLIGASCSLLRSHEKKEDKTKDRKSEDDSAAVEASSE